MYPLPFFVFTGIWPRHGFSADLQSPLDDYVKDTWPDGIVRILRMRERSGLIRARQSGAEAACGDVIIFLDAHCEATTGWYKYKFIDVALNTYSVRDGIFFVTWYNMAKYSVWLTSATLGS